MRYAIISATAVPAIDFSQVMETSPLTMRYSLDMTKTFVKFAGEIPSCLEDVAFEGPYTHGQISEILATADWSK